MPPLSERRTSQPYGAMGRELSLPSPGTRCNPLLYGPPITHSQILNSHSHCSAAENVHCSYSWLSRPSCVSVKHPHTHTQTHRPTQTHTVHKTSRTYIRVFQDTRNAGILL